MSKTKMTMHQVRRNLSRLMERNFAKGKVAASEEMREVYQDIAILAKCVRIMEKGSPTVGAKVEIEVP